MRVATYRDVNDTPDAALAVLLKDSADVLGIDEVDCELIDLSRVLVLLGRIGGEGIARDLGQAVVDLGVRVVEVIDRYDLEATGLLQDMDDMRACREQSTLSKRPPFDSTFVTHRYSRHRR